MSTHINANVGDIAQAILLPGDPLRAKFIAQNFLTDAKCYNEVRGMLGFTGLYKGKKISVQGTGMGQPSMSIYATELIKDYGVKFAIRIGTCGAISTKVNVKDTILALGACSDSGILKQRFCDLHFAPTASYALLKKADSVSSKLGIECKVGTVASSDLFYDENANYKKWASYGVLGVEMESAELYTLSKKYGIDSLAILTVSDNILTKEATTAQERQTTFTNMMQIALDTLFETI